MNEASEVTNKQTVNVFSAVGFVASDEGNASHELRCETTVEVNALPGSECIESKDPKVQ